jgi:hypothetical protein
MKRREFTRDAALLLLGGAAVTISGCGGGSPTASTPPPDAVGVVDSNHGHTAVITSAALVNGGALEVDIRGTSSHGHMVRLTADEVVAVRHGSRVEVRSSGSSHAHTVVFNG